MKFVTSHVCSFLNISLKYMKQLPWYFLWWLLSGKSKTLFFGSKEKFGPTTLLLVRLHLQLQFLSQPQDNVIDWFSPSSDSVTDLFCDDTVWVHANVCDCVFGTQTSTTADQWPWLPGGSCAGASSCMPTFSAFASQVHSFFHVENISSVRWNCMIFPNLRSVLTAASGTSSKG